MPDKRQQSKQRRAARNRATRAALAARRENAEANATSPPPSSSSSRSSEPSGRAGRQAGPATAPGGPPRGLGEMVQGTRPGDRAVLLSLVFALGGAIALLFYRVPVDDRGEALPVSFRAVAVMARERIIGRPLPDDSATLLDVSGPGVLLMIGLPVLVTLFAVWGNRRPDRARMLTFAMLALAGTVILTGGLGLFFFPAMIVLAVGGFRARRADLPAATAERVTRPARGRGRRGGDVIDVDSQEVAGDPESSADAAGADDAAATGPADAGAGPDDADGGPEGAGAGPDDADADGAAGDAGAGPDDTDADGAAGESAGDDPLAELEAELQAEMEAERDAGEGEADDAPEGGARDRGRRRRGR